MSAGVPFRLFVASSGAGAFHAVFGHPVPRGVEIAPSATKCRPGDEPEA